MHPSLRKFCSLRAAILVSAFSAVLPAAVSAQDKPLAPRFGTPIFQHLTRNSGYIFSGTVTSISRVEPTSSSVGTMKITFHVEHAFRGVRAGQNLVIREWAGLWESGEHYRVGERVALFLFSPGKLGLTSPVGRRLGRFEIDSYGRILLNREHTAAISADPVLASPWHGRTHVAWREFANGIRRASEN